MQEESPEGTIFSINLVYTLRKFYISAIYPKCIELKFEEHLFHCLPLDGDKPALMLSKVNTRCRTTPQHI